MSTETTVLIVDDEQEIREVLDRLLTGLGYTCTTAADGHVALDILRRNDVDVTLADLVMPEMDGIGLLDAITKEGLDTAVIVMSGRGTILSAVDAIQHGAFDFIEKVHPVGSLQRAIERGVSHQRLRRHARAMTEASQWWQTTFDAVPDLIAIVDDQHRFIRVNKAMAERLGCAPEEAVGMTCDEWVHGSAATPPYCRQSDSPVDGPVRIAEAYEKRLGGYFLMSTSPLRDTQGQLIGSVHVARDITEQKRIEKELRKGHDEMERLLTSMSSFLIEVDADLRVVRWNATAEATFGIAAHETVGRRFTECKILWDWAAISRLLPDWLKAERPIRLSEMRYTKPDGTEGILGITVNAVKDGEAKPSGFFLLGADISERKTLEAQLVQAQKLESIGQLAAGIAHEINTPTQYVGDNTRFLQDAFADLGKLQARYERLLAAARDAGFEGGLTADIDAAKEDVGVAYLLEEIPKAIQQSLEGVERVARIVRAMKEFSHPGSEEKTPIDLNKTIESTITVARNEWKYVAEMVTDFDANLPLVCCLPGEFNQVILNIIINAAHAIADVVGDGAEKKGRITVSTRRDGDWAEIRIGDTGTGIPEVARDRVFDPFFTTKKVGKGTGQGLTIAHNVIVGKHAGTIAFETEIGKGTTFIIRLPVDES